MKIGDKVSLKGLSRCLSHSGIYTYIDPPIDVDGVVTQKVSHFNERVCIEFVHEYQKCTVWKDAADISA